MDEQPQSQVKGLLLQVFDKRLPERQAIYDRLGVAPELRQEVESLINAGEQSPIGFLSNGHGKTADLPRLTPQSTVGPYEIRSVLGRGGMSIVYRARQNEPVQRDVAVKVLHPALNSTAILARFELERRLLARLNHPNIAQLYDAGSDSSGNPYFVMELVDGPNLLEYCHERVVPLRDCLELFVRVCRAVQHAHDRGILHRDLKPSNILILFQDALPVPKVIDFGVSRWMDADESVTSTLVGDMIGTPQYMSPEQSDGRLGDIDVRTDVFSLGVIASGGAMPGSSSSTKSAANSSSDRRARVSTLLS